MRPALGGSIALAGVLALSGTPAQSADSDEPADSVKQALTDGELTVALRYRVERVDDEAFADAAVSSTLRTAVSYRTRPYAGVSAHVEFTNVLDVGTSELYNDAGVGPNGNGVRDRPVVADPEMTRVHQASAVFERGATRVEAGRLALALDNQRFVGPVGWRQNNQSFAAARIVNRSIPKTTLSYAFLERAYTVTGGERPMSSHLIHAAVSLAPGTAVGYAYLLDFDRVRDVGSSSATFGLRFSGTRTVGSVEVGYEAEYAHQQAHGSQPGRLSADYFRVVGSVGRPRLGLEAGYEVLTGNERDGRFTTPLATLHAFNGWVDKFLGTPEQGLADLFVGLRGRLGSFAWRAAYHDFDAEGSGGSYGREVDVLATYRTPWEQTFAAKAGFYDARGFSTDSTKLWLWSEYSF